MKLKQRVLEKRGFTYERAKRMYYRHSSSCCGGETQQQALYNEKPLTEPFNQLTDKQQNRVIWRQFCLKCGNQCKLEWESKHD